MKYKQIVWMLLLICQWMVAQTDLVKIEAKLESESFHRTIVDNSKVFFLRAVNHKEVTQKQLVLSCYSALDLREIWSKPIVLSQYHNVLNFNLAGNILNILCIKHDLDTKQAELSVHRFSIANGEEIATKIIWKTEIGTWQNSKGKAEVAQSFVSAMDSEQSENDVTPLEYRIAFGFSPDSTKAYGYRFDNSQEQLRVEVKVFNSTTFEIEHQVGYYVDDAHIAYGVRIDNAGDIYQLKVSNASKLAVLKIDAQSEVKSYLQLPSSSTNKTNPQLFIHKNHQAYVAYSNVKGDYLVGVSVALLDFDTETVEDSHTYLFEADFLKRQEIQLKNGNHYFEMAEIEEHDNKLFLILEQHFIEGIDIHYEPNATEQIELWREKNAIVTTGNIAILVFDKSLLPLSCLEISKTQRGSNFDGLNTLGHHLVYHNKEMYFIYSRSTKGIVNDQLIVQRLDKTALRWSEYRKVKLDKKYLPVITSCNIINDKKILAHTRKGLTGNNNYFKIYEY